MAPIPVEAPVMRAVPWVDSVFMGVFVLDSLELRIAPSIHLADDVRYVIYPTF
jgi:hypothetical protein